VSNLGRLAGRSCLIVGGTSGIGLASARRFLQEGARVALTGPTRGTAEAALEVLHDLGPVQALTADVAEPDSVEAAFAETILWLGRRLDALLHVAGISGRPLGDGPLHECSLEAWDGVHRINSRGMFVTNRLAVRAMQAQERDSQGLRGSIVNIASVLASSPSPEFFGTIAYAASKGAVLSLTRAAAARYAPEGIRFNAISPGVIDSPMAARAVANPVIHAYLETRQPLGPGPGSPEDCAEAALYLCEPASRFVTGTELIVDGGWCVSEGQIPTDPRPKP
jgi:NAD(P)-dependent dehydrogenase (short-subunit alcohol dehydrogenase family)